MRQIFTALDHMHAKGVFHRDIKVRPQAFVPSMFLLLPIPSSTLAVPFSHCIPAREHTSRQAWQAFEACRLWVGQRDQQQAAIHGVYLH